MRVLKFSFVFLCIALLLVGLALVLGPAKLERSMNGVLPHSPYRVSNEARELHETLVIGDWHSDSTLWNRNLLERGDRGHLDIPRMREGNQAVQMFTSVTKSPDGQNYEKNSTDARDNITSLVLLQVWPPATWSSLTARALYQAEKLHSIAEEAPDQFLLIRNRQHLHTLLSRRANGETIVGGLLGTEG
jgi:membrane dipeptidase